MVSYPWEKDPKGLPDNRQQAMKRLEAMESRLETNPEHAKAYDTQIMEMKDLNFARKLEEKEINDYNGPIHCIAHHSVVKSQTQSKSTPIRIVFNLSSLCTKVIASTIIGSKAQIYLTTYSESSFDSEKTRWR
jgi:hypothetical protein